MAVRPCLSVSGVSAHVPGRRPGREFAACAGPEQGLGAGSRPLREREEVPMSSRLPRLRSIATGVLAVAVPAALAVAVAAPAASARTHGHDNEFRQTNLVSDLTTVGAQIVDPNLKNPWGLAFGPTTPLWVA